MHPNLKVVSATFLLVCFVSLKETTCETRINVFLFHFKNSFCSWHNQILTFQIFRCPHSSNPPPPPPPFKGVEIDLTKNPQKGGMEKLLNGRGILRRGDDISLGIFSSWCVANVIITFNYILVIVFLFPLNVGVSPCFHSAVLVPVYWVYTSCSHNAVVSFCYRLHTSCLHHAGVTSSFRQNMWF